MGKMGWLPDHIWRAQKARQGVKSGGNGWKGGGNSGSSGNGKWRKSGDISNPSKVMWVGGLKPNTTYQELLAHGQRVGNAIWAQVYQNKGTGTGVIGFSSAEEALDAVTQLKATKLKGATLQTDTYERQNAKPAAKKWGGGGSGFRVFRVWGKGGGKQKKNSDIKKPANCVWVGGIPEGTSYADLKAHADEEAGNVAVWAQVYKNKGSGTGVIGYASPSEAASAAEVLDGTVLNGSAIHTDMYEKQNPN